MSESALGPSVSGGQDRCLITLVEPRSPLRQAVVIGHAGAGIAPFRSWIGRGEGATALRAVRLPGRESRFDELPHRSVGAMAEEITASLQGRPALPTVLYGHCLGAFVMYEVARELSRADFPLERLIVGAQLPPEEEAGATPEEAVSELSAEEFWRALQDAGGVADEILQSPPLMELLEPALRADWGAAERYRAYPRAELSCCVMAVAGSSDATLSSRDLAGWAAFTVGEFRSLEIEGGHFILDQSTVDGVRKVVMADG